MEKVWRGHHPDSMVAKFAEDCDNIGVKVGNMVGCQEENFVVSDDNGRGRRWLGQSCAQNCGTSPIISCNRADSHLFITLPLNTTASIDGSIGGRRELGVKVEDLI